MTLDQAAIGTEGQSIVALRRHASLRGIVAVTTGGSPGLCPSNARSFAQPFGIPVLQVGSEHQAFLNQVAAGGTPVTLVASATRTPEQAFNVVATVTGRQPDLAPLAVMTPRSGWWHCASERGGGIACWIETLRAVSAARPARPVIFLASSGHELGHHGLDAFLRAHPELIKGARAWIHLGANIGAAGGQMRLQASDDEMEASALRALEEAGASVGRRVPRGNRAVRRGAKHPRRWRPLCLAAWQQSGFPHRAGSLARGGRRGRSRPIRAIGLSSRRGARAQLNRV